MEARMEKQAEYVVVIPGVTGPTYTRAVQQAIDASVHWSYLPEVHGAVTIADVPPNRVLGVDVSHWQAKRDVVPVVHMDWEKCKQAGAQFAYIRAGSVTQYSGENYFDFEFEYNTQAISGLMPFGYYWYFRPQHDPIGQANYFIDLIEGKDWRLPPVVDVEHTGGDLPRKGSDALSL